MIALLSKYFDRAAGKRLSAGETNPATSNQHEFNGARPLTALFGEPAGKTRFDATFLSIDDDLETEIAQGSLTWYDARQRKREAGGAQRWEYRLYYTHNPVMDAARAGDYCVIARTPDGELHIIVAPGDSTVAVQLQSMFGLAADDSSTLFTSAEVQDAEPTMAARTILEALGFEVRFDDAALLDGLLAAFGQRFPSTTSFSAYTRGLLPDASATTDPDGTLWAWMEMEEKLFRTLERHLVTESLKELQERGGLDELDAFLKLAQGVFQRRKARAGQALENHMQAVLDDWGIPYTRGARTEGAKRPDFLFPGEASYHEMAFPSDRLRMLGAKRTCKDRWRQVLNEADRIPRKHLLTLEAPISPAQMAEMDASNLQLVLPTTLHGLFAAPGTPNLMSVRDFLEEVRTVCDATI